MLKVTPVLLLASITALAVEPAKADEITAGVKCMGLGYTVVDPIYMGRTLSGYEQWACASESGINIKGPPFPVVLCPEYGLCRFVGWTY
jgi:hypothetical protein